ncbi:DEAD/DEAH box helicase [Thiohalocapsa marina]|uniref:DEAD/DEAH box helicase n=1 Tax=Thiohalocapsa marina TaxID=424902 RepID=A0A5M8FKS0_9GAMM|nr:DEAD/DEAH box helicase [Thiohalocapsa marina]KAA6184336.1 DEAD/DEAH box helicase [Thiohalocapsa marina]
MPDIRSRYRALDEDARRVLRVLSVVCEPVSQTTLKLLLDQLGWRTKAGAPLSQTLDKAQRERLLDSGVIRQSRNNLVCHPDLLEPLTRETVADGSFEAIVAAAEQVVPTPMRNAWDRPTEERRFRLLRIALYSGREDKVLEMLGVGAAGKPSQVRYREIEPLVRICTRSADPAWMERLPARLKILSLAPMLREAALDLQGKPASYQLMEHLLTPLADSHADAAEALAEQRLLRARLDQVPALLQGRDDPDALQLSGWLSVLRGDYGAALEQFDASLKATRKLTRKRNLYVPGLPGVLHLLALLHRGERGDYLQVQQQVEICLRASITDLVEPVYRLIGDLAAVLSGQRRLAESAWLLHSLAVRGELPLLFQALALHWLGKRPSAEALSALAAAAERAAAAGLHWYAFEAVSLLQQCDYEGPLPALGPVPDQLVLMTGLLAPKPAWELALEALQGLGGQAAAGSAPAAAGDADRRLAWLLTGLGDTRDHGYATLEPREQKRTKRGGWTAGRAVSLQKLAEEPERFPYLTPQDRALCACIVREQNAGWYGSYGRVSYHLDPERALPAAVGHPLILRPGAAPEATVELTHGKPTLSVIRRSKDMLVSLEPYPLEGRSMMLQEETTQRLRVIRFEAGHREIARILGPEGLSVPQGAEARLLQGLAAVAPMLTVHSDIGGGDQHAETVPADPQPHVHLSPLEDGLALELYVHPFGDGGPQLRPGEGRATLFTELAGRAVRCTRALDLERTTADDVIAQCPALAGNDGWSWMLDEPELALSALEQLHAQGDRVVLDWPHGRRISLSDEMQVGRMQVTVKQRQDWLDVSGGLTLDDGRVLAMRELLELAAAARGRFVRLGDNDYLVLSNALRRRLDGLHRLTEGGRFHPLAAPAIAELIDGMALETSRPWEALLQRLEAIQELQPEVPSTLQADLREYQLEGYRWLARLAHWGAGACLADDMGLGKTVQSLALILSRAPQGPTLVLAPTSVCGNWLEEAQRFAPTLRPMRFGPGDRAAMLQQAGPFDLIVASYGLLQSEAERLTEVHWETIIADEAQAFKNALTKRSKAIMQLQGNFRMITTGTPIENHLGELWNLFRFINPGLLGSLDRFNRRFAVPIEQDKDQGARQRLRQLLKPFILRRLKSEVLAELPPRTEITLQLELSQGEMALYEAMRQQAIEQLDEKADGASPGHKRLQLLAEIMRLRRACCHPRLALPDSDLPATKLEAFGEIVDELLDNRHKALVFSQFVDHLALIRDYLDQRDIRYQYFDGSTPEPKRRAAVDAFQAGEGDLFLISLRAGGAGLNLTAADYVIHMDPWWNPAVEDQASDRAHRIGQQRPVTVYRLVAKNTIEERILKLHGSKRDLADGLLIGTEDGGKLSYEDMLALVRESGA